MTSVTSLQQSLEMTRGDTRQWSFSVLDASSLPVSLASHHGLWFTGKRSVADPDASAIFQKSLPSGATAGGGFSITSLANGTGAIKLDPVDTSSLEPAILQLSFDLQFVDASANKYTVSAGKLIVRPDVTLA